MSFQDEFPISFGRLILAAMMLGDPSVWLDPIAEMRSLLVL
jgi:hypothetical protein